MVNFCKNARCPSSTELLAFQTGSQTPKEAGAICRHLIKCDFCTAELEFYAHYPPVEEKIEIGEIPKPLYELAEALLSNRHKDFSLLNKLLCENEGLTLEKV